MLRISATTQLQPWGGLRMCRRLRSFRQLVALLIVISPPALQANPDGAGMCDANLEDIAMTGVVLNENPGGFEVATGEANRPRWPLAIALQAQACAVADHDRAGWVVGGEDGSDAEPEAFREEGQGLVEGVGR